MMGGSIRALFLMAHLEEIVTAAAQEQGFAAWIIARSSSSDGSPRDDRAK
jgi:hypothetical protein